MRPCWYMKIPSITIYIPHNLNVLVYIFCHSSSTGCVLKREREDISLQYGLRDLSKSYAEGWDKEGWVELPSQPEYGRRNEHSGVDERWSRPRDRGAHLHQMLLTQRRIHSHSTEKALIEELCLYCPYQPACGIPFQFNISPRISCTCHVGFLLGWPW